MRAKRFGVVELACAHILLSVSFCGVLETQAKPEGWGGRGQRRRYGAEEYSAVLAGWLAGWRARDRSSTMRMGR